MNELEQQLYQLTLQHSATEIIEALHKAYINRSEWHIKRGDYDSSLRFLERAGAMTRALEALQTQKGE